jgi:hypothetical protein
VTGSATDLQTLTAELKAHPKCEELAGFVRQACMRAAELRDVRFPLTPATDPPNPEPDAHDPVWATAGGNVLTVLAEGAKSREQVELVAAWLALGVRQDFPSSPETEFETAARLVWLAAHSPCNALAKVDAVLDDGRAAFWAAIARLVEDPLGGGADFGRTESLIALAALRDSDSAPARARVAELSSRLSDPSSVLIISCSMRVTVLSSSSS